MRVSRAGLLLLIFFVLFLPVQAFDANNINVSSGWAIAGGDPVSVEVLVKADGGGNAFGATVSVTSTNLTMGTVSPSTRSTDLSGNAIFSFQPGLIAGDVSLFINVTYNSTVANKSYIQKIDHSDPRYYESVIYPLSVNVSETANISVRLKDDYGNLIDARRENDTFGNTTFAEKVAFAEAIRSDSGFGAIGIHDVAIPVDLKGNATVIYFVSKVAGDNIIRISAPKTVISNVTWIDIIGKPVDPATISSLITSPTDGTEALANGKDQFSITYTVYDRFGNPVPNIPISWSSSNGEQQGYMTNLQGYVFFTYGPSTVIQYNISLTAVVTQNPTINRTDYVSFIPEGVIFTLIADPDNIPSLDVNNASFSYIRALLTDGSGRPKVNEVVYFDIESETANPFVVKKASFNRAQYNSSITAPTNVYGYAVVPLYPGQFNETDTTATVKIRAQWVGPERDFTSSVYVIYKNYPILSLRTSVSPLNITNNSIFNLTITLIGDGVLPHKPIDVMLCDSRGSTMLQDLYYSSDPSSTKEDKEVYAQQTIWDFTYHLNNKTDRVGLVTFGMNGTTDVRTGPPSYGAGEDGLDPKKPADNESITNYTKLHYMPFPKDYFYSTLEIPLTLATDNLRDEIYNDNVTPSKVTVLGGGTNVVPARYGLYMALKEIATNSTSGKVRGVIFLLDDKITSWGDPLGPAGTGSCQGVFNASNPYSDPTVLDDCVKISQGGSGYCAFSDLGDCNNPMQNLAAYANNLSTKIFVVLLPQKGCQIDNSIQALGDVLALSTGGKRYSACNAQDLDKIYENISQLLMVYASVDTNMTLAFENLSVTYNNISSFLPHTDVFDYQFINGSSTYITSWNRTTCPSPTSYCGNPINDTLPVPPYPSDAIPGPINGKYIKYPYTLDQTDEWIAGQLKFYIGNVTIGQTWQANLSFKAKQPGLIEILSNTSSVCFSSGPCQWFNSTNVPVEENISPIASSQNLVEIINHTVILEPTNSTEFVKVSWVTNYTGNYTLIQSSYYRFSRDGVRFTPLWTQFGVNITTNRNITLEQFSKLLDVTDLIGYIMVNVTAQEILPNGQYGNWSWGANITPFEVGVLNQPYIKIT